METNTEWTQSVTDEHGSILGQCDLKRVVFSFSKEGNGGGEEKGKKAGLRNCMGRDIPM